MTTIKIEVRDRKFPTRQNGRTFNEYDSKARVYFSHEGENILENFGNRAARPYDLYKQFLPEVGKALGGNPHIKFRWSQKAGCSCGCSPGFIAEGVRRKDVWVTLSADAPKTDGTEAGEALVRHRTTALLGDPTISGALEAVAEKQQGEAMEELIAKLT